jgi:hypothetical protein
MRTLDGSPMNKALPMLLGVTLAGWASATPVFAQNTTNQGAMPQDNSTRAAITPDATMQDVLGEVPQDPNLIPDPMPMNYPFAAPGELPLLHWVDYTKFNARPGSVSDVNFYKDKLRRVDYDENGRVRKTAAPLSIGVWTRAIKGQTTPTRRQPMRIVTCICARPVWRPAVISSISCAGTPSISYESPICRSQLRRTCLWRASPAREQHTSLKRRLPRRTRRKPIGECAIAA